MEHARATEAIMGQLRLARALAIVTSIFASASPGKKLPEISDRAVHVSAILSRRGTRLEQARAGPSHMDGALEQKLPRTGEPLPPGLDGRP